MLSVIVAVGAPNQAARRSPQEAAVRSLAALVPLAVRGLVRDVALAGPPDMELRLIADRAGCGCFENPDEPQRLALAIAACRLRVVLILCSGFVPEPGFAEAVEDFLENPAPGEAVLLRAAPASLLRHLHPRLSPVAGVIVPREACLEKSVLDFAALARLARGRTLSARARYVG